MHTTDLNDYNTMLKLLDDTNHGLAVNSQLNLGFVHAKDYAKLAPIDKFSFRKYQPEFIHGTDIRTNQRNAVIERKELVRVNDAIFHAQLEDFYKEYISNRNEIGRDQQMTRAITNNKLTASVIDLQTGKFTIKHPQCKHNYTHCFDGVDFKKLNIIKGHFSCHQASSRYVIVSVQTELMSEKKMFDVLSAIPLNEIDLPPISLVQGVPGCGKSTYIINNATDCDLILTTTKAAANDMQDRRMKKTGNPKLSQMTRTIDSYLLNKRNKAVKVFIDEAIMSHAGNIVAVAFFSQAKEVVCLGDTAQIPFISRTPTVQVKYERLNMITIPKEFLSVSHRCPVDVIAKIADQYEQHITTTNYRNNTMVVKRINSYKDPPYKADSMDKRVQYITFTQADKMELKRQGIDGKTINEFQGSQSEIIKLVRFSQINDAIYSNISQILVAISRHTKQFICYSIIEDDLCKIVRRVVPPEDIERHKEPRNELSGVSHFITHH